ncbi:TetR/AcrR family transcriptional regulator [Corynebacterium cystitidis]|uniref:TetR/AcrR family transcriptional regulator n=1 Tax=Corynebacterium cystitidis TaxID=35757 RepID=UPI00211E0721|nr:TetR/AcrR family transcriptional regulator [Corynebacterium cystitidis]
MNEMKVTPDGRSTRWEKHRQEKREQLLADTIRALRKHGASVHMDAIADTAGTSKAVFYRHFTDRAGLWSAVVARTVEYIYRHLPLAPRPTTPLPRLVHDLAETYLTLVDKDPAVYAFVTTTPDAAIGDGADPVVTLTALIGERLAQLLREHGFEKRSDIIAQAIVGAIWAVTDRWVATGQIKPKDEILAALDELFTPYLDSETRN